MRSVVALVLLLVGCDELNKPMPMTGGSPSIPAPVGDAGSDAAPPPPSGEPPRVSPAPGDTQL